MRFLPAVATALCVSASNLGAQWAEVGGGDYGVTFGYRTFASFSCTAQHYALQPCTSDGTTLTQWNGSAFATMSFTGVTNSVTASNVFNGPIAIGALNVRYGGTGPFTWPGMIAPDISSIAMNLQLQVLDGPNATTGSIRLGLTHVSPSFMRLHVARGGSNYMLLPLPYPQPSHLNYSEVALDHFNLPAVDQLTDADYAITVASVSVIPEPGTYALTLIGMVAVGIAARRRRI